MDWFSFQGISDAAAEAYIAEHGNVTYAEIARALAERPCSCSKLTAFGSYVGCGYRKGRQTCAQPNLISECPVPSHDLRNGNLNRAAYSLFLFLRDVCQGDLVGFIDLILAEADVPGHPDRLARMRRALLRQLTKIHGVSSKLVSMTFADLLLGAGADRARWIEVGASMVAVDSLVHNFLHRTGILSRLQADHLYGPGCYGEAGCAGIIDRLARQIDCRSFGAAFPAYFPRFVQYCLWLFCAQDHRNICNGNKIDDSKACENGGCPIYTRCGRVPLNPDKQ